MDMARPSGEKEAVQYEASYTIQETAPSSQTTT